MVMAWTAWCVFLIAPLVVVLSIFYLKFEYILTYHRGVFVCLFLLPLSFVYEFYFYLRNSYILYTRSAPLNHHIRVKIVQDSVRACRKQGKGIKMCTARPSFLTMSFKFATYKDTHWKVPVNLYDVLEINQSKRTVKVEPLVTMGQISATLIPRGWTLPIVPELDDLTVGGLIMGVGVETSSHIYGLFQHICLSYDIVVADGNLVHCSTDENSDLYYSIPWSHGTLGFLVAVEIMIIPCQPYVKLDYIPCESIEKFYLQLKNASSKKDNHFVEGIIFSKESGVVIVGKMCEKPKDNSNINAIGRFWKPWFFTHVQKHLVKGSSTEYIPLRDYYHRHTRSLFWEMQDILPFGNNSLFRYTLGWLVPPKVSLLKLTQTKTTKRLYEEKHVVQDLLIPLDNLSDAIEIFHREFFVYPLWICPFNLPNNPGMVKPSISGSVMYTDIGAYGVPRVSKFTPGTSLRAVEAFVRSINGFQMLYAETRMSRDEFEDMFDHKLYLQMREKYGCKEAFPDVYDKVGKHAWK